MEPSSGAWDRVNSMVPVEQCGSKLRWNRGVGPWFQPRSQGSTDWFLKSPRESYNLGWFTKYKDRLISRFVKITDEMSMDDLPAYHRLQSHSESGETQILEFHTKSKGRVHDPRGGKIWDPQRISCSINYHLISSGGLDLPIVSSRVYTLTERSDSPANLSQPAIMYPAAVPLAFCMALSHSFHFSEL